MQLLDKLRILALLLRGALDQWRTEIWGHDLDKPFCCSRHECGCMGASLRDVYMWQETK